MNLANKLTWLSLLWPVAGLSVSDRDLSQLGEHLRFDCFSKGNLIPLTYLKVSSWIGFLTSQDTKAASGRFSARPVVLLWHSVKPLFWLYKVYFQPSNMDGQRHVPRVVTVSREHIDVPCKNGISYDYNPCDRQKAFLQSFSASLDYYYCWYILFFIIHIHK